MTLKKILVIDDEIDIREIARISMEMSKGWEVITATNGKEGLLVASEQQPDAILLDLTMPEMDGLTTLRQLKKHHSTKYIPVILLTAQVQSTIDQDYLKSGAKAIFIKPFDPVILGDQVELSLGWR
ncbi:MAG: Regulatory protein AtoC [Chroococcopsis gigantea SAG 12.99]|jgi:CheY-like chemotaxis protein|nr:response regulator [Chlorogloea purpurea SAG 13.99]MDV3001636.1 Regulatory protein AtoC [Chroococcopsis gigantea SAG 12.99]